MDIILKFESAVSWRIGLSAVIPAVCAVEYMCHCHIDLGGIEWRFGRTEGALLWIAWPQSGGIFFT